MQNGYALLTGVELKIDLHRGYGGQSLFMYNHFIKSLSQGQISNCLPLLAPVIQSISSNLRTGYISMLSKQVPWSMRSQLWSLRDHMKIFAVTRSTTMNTLKKRMLKVLIGQWPPYPSLYHVIIKRDQIPFFFPLLMQRMEWGIRL